MLIAIMAFGDRNRGDNTVGLEIISRIDAEDFPVQVAVVRGGTEVLRTLERANRYEAIVLIDTASMGESPGTLRTFDLNELVLRDPPRSLILHGMKMNTELLFAHKFFNLPPTRLICVEPETHGVPPLSERLLSRMDSYLAAIRAAVDQLSESL